MATFMVLGFIMFVLPVIKEPAEAGQIERIRMSERLSTMDVSGDISSYITKDSANLSGLGDKIASESETPYTYSVGTVSYATGIVLGNRQLDFIQGENIITEMTVTTLRNNVIESPETIIWDSTGPKDVSIIHGGTNLTSTRLGPTSLRINFVSSAELGEYHYQIKKVEMEGLLPENTTVWVSSYLPTEGDLMVFSSE